MEVRMHTDVRFARKSGAEGPLLSRLAASKSAPEIEPFAGDARTGKIWSTALSLQAFCQRAALLSQLELPCTVHIATPALEQRCNGVIKRIERTDDRLSLLGEGFSLHLCTGNIAAIWLVNPPASVDGAPAVEIHNKAGGLATRIAGPQDRIGSAVWQDVMGNPSLGVC
jgi:putative heme degradation protein